MKRFTLLFTLLSLGIFITILPGCSTEDAITNLIQGDTNSAEFQFVENIVGAEGFEAVGLAFDFSFAVIDSIPGSTFSPKNLGSRQALGVGDEVILFDSLSYVYDGGWHVFSFSATIVDTIFNDSISISGIDSVQTLSNGQPMQVPDMTVDELRIRAHFDIVDLDGSLTGSGDHSLTVTGFTPEMLTPIVINGTATETASGTDGDSSFTCNFTFTNSLTVTNITFIDNGVVACPTAGSISLSSTVDMTCIGGLGTAVDTITVAGGWTAIGVFASDGSIAITISDGTTVWQTTEPCEQQPPAGPRSRWTHGF